MQKKLVVLSVFAVISVLLLVGCSQAPQAPTEIRVGVNAPLTGIHAGFGQGGVYGLQAAVEDLNKTGGVYVKQYDKKLPIKLIVRDNESDPSKSQALEEQLILQDKVNFNTPPNQPLPLVFPQAALADRYKIPRISGGTPMEPWLGARRQTPTHWEYSWNFGFAIATPAPKGAYWEGPEYTIKDTWVTMLQKYGPMTNKKVAVFASDEPDGRGWYSLFPKVLKDAGYNVVGMDKNLGLLPMETTDFSTVISQWKAANVEILWGNAPGPFFGAMWKQARAMGFKPKIVSIGRAPLFYTDVNSWGGDLPNGIGVEIWWDPSWQDSPGIGGTTPQSLADRWSKSTGRPLDPGIGWGYQIIQVLADAVQRAGTLDGPQVNQALATTDIKTVAGRVKFDDEHYNHKPLVFGQWQASNKPEKWALPIVYSNMPSVPTNGKYLFPVPYGK